MTGGLPFVASLRLVVLAVDRGRRVLPRFSALLTDRQQNQDRTGHHPRSLAPRPVAPIDQPDRARRPGPSARPLRRPPTRRSRPCAATPGSPAPSRDRCPPALSHPHPTGTTPPRTRRARPRPRRGRAGSARHRRRPRPTGRRPAAPRRSLRRRSAGDAAARPAGPTLGERLPAAARVPATRSTSTPHRVARGAPHPCQGTGPQRAIPGQHPIQRRRVNETRPQPPVLIRFRCSLP